MEKNTELENAVNAFVWGEFYFGRQPASKIYDYDSIKHLAFGERVDGRTDEFIVYDQNPIYVMDTIEKLGIKKDYWVTVLSEEKPHRYETEGFTIKREEFLMHLHLDDWSFKRENKIIEWIKDEEKAQHINRFLNRNAVDLGKLSDPKLHFYVGQENGAPASYGSYAHFDKTVFLNNVFTLKIHRGKGLATALCGKMLLDAKQKEAGQSVLISSQMGHPLYLKLGFKDVSKMWVFDRTS